MPTERNVYLQDVRPASSPRVLWLAGFSGATIDDLRFRDCTFRGAEAAEVLSGAGAIAFRNVTIEPAAPAKSLNTAPVSTPAP